MSDHSVTARRPRTDRSSGVRIARDPDVLRGFLEDAAHFPGGHADGIATPSSEADVADLIASARAVLPIGAQSSLTGGATPMGGVLLSTAKLNRIVDIGSDSVRVQAGVTLSDLDAALAAVGKYYPPTPTFMGAFVGGVIATNAAGASTFKYGTTRDWVRKITVVLPGGDVIDLERGKAKADSSGRLDFVLADRTARVQIPRYRLPHVPKVSAGYFAASGMDAIDLFIGSEGTLGVITEATLRVVDARPATALVFVPCMHREQALALVATLRDSAGQTWRSNDRNGLDISAIEHFDARSLELLREDGADRKYGVKIPDGAVIALLVTMELPPETTAASAFDQIGRAHDRAGADAPLARLARTLEEAGVLDGVEIAMPGDHARAGQLLALREEVPAAVNARVGRAKAAIDQRISKTAADMIVPFESMEPLLTMYDDEFRRRGLDAAVWGHISDGNLHPNVIPRSLADVESGKAAILEFGRAVLRLGGSPLAEHGVGRHAVKQQLLREMYGEDGIADMRAIKRALDPEWKLSPGVLFPRE